MSRISPRLAVVLVLAGAVAPARALQQAPAAYNVRSFGATGDGKSLDSDAINQAIDAASAAGGGIVDLPAGRYRSFSIRLKSHVTLRFFPGAVRVAADPASGLGQYDLPEPNPVLDLMARAGFAEVRTIGQKGGLVGRVAFYEART